MRQSPNTSQSSLHHTLGSGTARSSKQRRYKSQYPLDSDEHHVEYILVASFHIDRGPIMEHQYPAPISGDESMLAELMLPDQTHVRSQDWTIFFLHKDTTPEEEQALEEKEARKKARATALHEDDDPDGSLNDGSDTAVSEAESSDDDEGSEGPPLMYVLNLVNTKQDHTVKRYVFSDLAFHIRLCLVVLKLTLSI